MKREIPQIRNHSEKSGWLRFMTLAVACGLVVIALWNGVRVMGVNGTRDRSSKAHQQAPTKFHTERDAISRKERSRKDPVLAFFERAKRGMTEAEIRGMVADFEVIEAKPNWLDLDECRAHMEKQNDWYAIALAEALSLSPEQNQAVRASLAELLDQAFKALNREDLPKDDQLIIIVREAFFGPNLYYRDSKESNQSLLYFCDLSEEQLKLTYKQALQKRSESAKKNPKPFNPEQLRYNYRSMSMHDALMGDFVDYPPPSNYDGRCTLHGTLRGGIIDVTNTFPLTPDQKLADHRDDLLVQAKLLHPAQLRMALLMNSGVFESLKHQLDSRRE